eukprot:jgi/Mesen1/724/ME000011S00059
MHQGRQLAERGTHAQPQPNGVDIFSQALKVLAVRQQVTQDGSSSLDLAGPGSSRRQGKDKKRRQRGKKALRRDGFSGSWSPQVPHVHGELSSHPQSYWDHVDEYFRDVTTEDVEMLLPGECPELDPAFCIPTPHAKTWEADVAAAEKHAAAQRTAVKVKRKMLTASSASKRQRSPGHPAGDAPPAASAPASLSLTAVISPPPNENDPLCHVCYNGDFGEGNQILFCDACDVAVHQDCYGVPAVPEGQWLCSLCKNQAQATAQCALCPWKGGAMKPVAPAAPPPAKGGGPTDAAPQQVPRFAHLFCCQWVPETYIESTDAMEPIRNVDQVSRERQRLACSLCREKCGFCVQCSHGMCAVAFHPLCARNAKLRMEIKCRSDGLEDSGAVELRAFCAKHSSSSPSPGVKMGQQDPHPKAAIHGAGAESCANQETPAAPVAGELQHAPGSPLVLQAGGEDAAGGRQQEQALPSPAAGSKPSAPEKLAVEEEACSFFPIPGAWGYEGGVQGVGGH